MAVSQVVRTVTVNVNGATKKGSVTVAKPASATALTANADVLHMAPEVSYVALVSGGTNTDNTLYYDCAGKSGQTYPVTLTVVDIATA